MATRKDFQPVVAAYVACILAGIVTLWCAPYLIPEGKWQALWVAFAADFVATVVVFVCSRIYRNSSLYDPYWSVIPPLLMIYWVAMFPESMDNIRTWLVFGLVTAWAIRLTSNWAIHWPGLHHEDWRYPIVRERAGRFPYTADFLGIHLFPTIQVFLGCLPIYLLVQNPQVPLGWLDAVAFIVTAGAITIQTIADLQLHAFIRTRQPGQLMDKGLWSWSRHPNYFGEIGLWFGLMLFGLAVDPSQWWWVCLGAAAMILMFVFASVPFLDNRSLERRPAYADYMKRTSSLIPLPPRRS